ncbi:rifin [Plasmodium sp. gorilla clade G1]|nr:rifin [Plasmodium sp. gorilla clade G1]
MKILFINILLFALPLNILVSYPKNTYIRSHTATTTLRLLCECDIYTSNYDNDPEMKAVIENYNRQTSDRFKEYDERMEDKRQKCKEQCDKEIQKIVLKDKLEKELAQKFSTLATNMDTNDIPTCVCKKSLADKTEKFCLNCGLGIGSGVLQASSLLGGIGEVALDAWKTAALVTAEELAAEAGVAAGKDALIPEAIKAVIEGLEKAFPIQKLGFQKWKLFITERHYANAKLISDTINSQYTVKCPILKNVAGADMSVCDMIHNLGLVEGPDYVKITTDVAIESNVSKIITEGTSAASKVAEATAKNVTAKLTTQNTGAVNTTYASCQTSIIASIVAILVIVLVMVIIYLILRYRRKTKMKKKLQYIKLLKE